VIKMEDIIIKCVIRCLTVTGKVYMYTFDIYDTLLNSDSKGI